MSQLDSKIGYLRTFAQDKVLSCLPISNECICCKMTQIMISIFINYYDCGYSAADTVVQGIKMI